MQSVRLSACVLLCALVCAPPARADVRYGLTQPDGLHYAVGGIGSDEAARLRMECQFYALCVRTAAKGSGAFVADVHLNIRHAEGPAVFDQVLEGPWLLIDLKPGSYVLRATFGDERHEKVVRVVEGGHLQEVLYFELPPDTTPGPH